MRAAIVCALIRASSALCSEVRNKLKELHLDVRDELARVFGAPPSNSTPQQRHLSLTGAPGELYLTWVVPDAGDVCGDAHVTLQPGGATFPATASTYDAGVAPGWHGHVYTSRFTGLLAGAQYTYTATSCGVSSAPARFTAPSPPGPAQDTLVGVMADMGTVVPLGFATAAQIEKDHAAAPFDLFLLAGDVAYATVDPVSERPRRKTRAANYTPTPNPHHSPRTLLARRAHPTPAQE